VATLALPRNSDAGRLLRWSGRALVAVTWVSAFIFGAYILAFYAGAVADGQLDRWNRGLEGLHGPGTPLATTGIAVHFAAGGILLLLGPVQLIPALRAQYPAAHRWTGRAYALAALLAGTGGLAFIATRGTIGGRAMDLGFGLYGVLMVVAAVETVRNAVLGRLAAHRAWALRLFALAIGSWLYRMDYAAWFLSMGRVGHTHDFRGAFDRVMLVAFYLPNLLLVELWLRARRGAGRPAVQIAAAMLLAGATLFVTVATGFFTVSYWGPPIVARLPLPM